MTLNVRLAAFYFSYYGTVGAFMAYWSPYLLARGFSAADMGVAYALMGLSRATIPVIWGWWTDRRGERMPTIRIAALLSLLIFAAIPLAEGVLAVTVLMLAYTLFWNALLPQFEVVALNHLRSGGGEYSRVRLWGSVGFVGSVLTVGPALDWMGIRWEPWLVAVLFAAMAALAWAVPDHRTSPDAAGLQPVASKSRADVPSMWSLLSSRPVLVLLAACFFSQLSFAPYYNFFTIYLERHGYTRSFAGQMWALAVVAEIIMFIYAGRLLAFVGARRLLLLALTTAVLRWLAIGLAPDSLSLLIAAQLLHATSFACYHLAAMHYVQALFPSELQGRGQALYNSAAYGIGGSLGALGSGVLWDAASPEALFVIAALTSVCGAWLVRYLPTR
jgi:PPP family 3-phenylpropionic acid transporter